jgi:hypothetical protein
VLCERHIRPPPNYYSIIAVVASARGANLRKSRATGNPPGRRKGERPARVVKKIPQVLALRAAGLTYPQIQELLNLCTLTICRICKEYDVIPAPRIPHIDEGRRILAEMKKGAA